MAEGDEKELIWVSSARKDLCDFPPEVRHVMGYALYLAQTGGKHPSAKPMVGFRGAGVLEVVEDFDGDTFRTVYTVRFDDAVYVLHAFQKKAKKGIATPQRDLKRVRTRLGLAQQDYEARRRGRRESRPK